MVIEMYELIWIPAIIFTAAATLVIYGCLYQEKPKKK
jgi:hypothetical protein